MHQRLQAKCRQSVVPSTLKWVASRLICLAPFGRSWWWPSANESAVSPAIFLRSPFACSTPSRSVFRIPDSRFPIPDSPPPFWAAPSGNVATFVPVHLVRVLSVAVLVLDGAHHLLAVGSGRVVNRFGPAPQRDVGKDELGKPDLLPETLRSPAPPAERSGGGRSG